MRLLVAGLLCWASGVFAAPVAIVPLEGAIGPASADFVRRAIERAATDGTQLVVLRIDTPGGLDSAMREIIKSILASPVPVASYVAPSGARAASAGTFIMYASHIAAMAPGTNLGAASPVAIMGGASDKDGKKSDDTMMHKAMNDAVAYIRGLAQLRRRNADWAEQAVREAVSLPADEALKKKVIDLIAPDVPALLRAVEGRTVEAGSAKHTLHVAGIAPAEFVPDWRTRFLGVITNPSVAYLLILLGAYALLFEFMNPGLILPGVVGTIALLVALYALHLLPVNYAGLALIFLGIGFMVAEAFFPTYGSLGIGGLIAFVLVAILLFMSLKVFREYERAVVFLLGRFQAVRGPGLIIIFPVIQQTVRVDLRTRVFDVPPQDVITRDNVSVKVNAVVYFRVVDPQLAIIQVANFNEATSQLAQTTLRAILGKHELDELLAEREKLNSDIQEVLDKQTDAWGIKVSNVEIKHVDINETMIRAIARQAEAERERRAKVIHAEGELQASEKLLAAAEMLSKRSEAMQLRYLQTLTQIAGDKASTIVFPVPMDLLGPLLGKK